MLRQKRFLVGGALVAVAIGYLGYTGFQEWATYYYKVSELFEQGDLSYDQSLRVKGQVAPGSIEREQGGLTTKFTVVEGGQSLPVVYRGALPDTFKEEADVVVEGRLDASGVFQADSIMMKCPSKYEPEEGE